MSDCNFVWDGIEYKVEENKMQDVSSGSQENNVIKAVITQVNMDWLTGQIVLFTLMFIYSLGYGIYVGANFYDYKLILYFVVVFMYLLYTIIAFSLNKSEFESLAIPC
jgi:hypothetical protein